MTLHAAVARRRLGFVQDDDRGRVLVDTVDAWMAGQAIRNPAHMARLFAPGFPDLQSDAYHVHARSDEQSGQPPDLIGDETLVRTRHRSSVPLR
jgi:hypothetical protein